MENRVLRIEPNSNRCHHCDMGDGFCIYPDYGVAPHYHDLSATGNFVGSTILLDKSKWPDNFVPDDDGDNCGTYTHCPNCGGTNGL